MNFGNVEYIASFISYPRTGSNWIAYCLQYLSEMEIVGADLKYQSKNPNKITKSHGDTKDWWNQMLKSKDGIILILRNYKECIAKHLKTSIVNPSYQTLIHDMTGKTPLDNYPGDYLSLIKAYDIYTGPKILVYYEDFIVDFKKEIIKMLSFLQQYGGVLDIQKINNFIENFDEHKNKSLELYQGKHARSDTRGDKNKLCFHSKTIPLDDKIQTDKYLLETFPDIFTKYLKRYAE